MNKNKKIAKKIKKSGSKAELESLFKACRRRNEKNGVSFCENGFLCQSVIAEGECNVIADYAKTHTIGDINNG